MKHIVKDIPLEGKVVEINDIDLITEWNLWYRKMDENPTTETYEEAKPLYDKIRERYNINTCIIVYHSKIDRNQLVMTITDIPVEDIIYHPSNSKWLGNKS